MSLFRRYDLIESPQELLIIRRRVRNLSNAIVYLVGFLLWYIVLEAQANSAQNELIYIFYLFPLLFISRIIKSIKSLIIRDKISFNFKLGDLIINDQRRAKLSNINCVIVDYDNKLDIQQCSLELQTSDEANIILDKSDAGMNKEVIETAKSIASFLKVPIQDLHPYEEKL
ncbi:hypothetical protein BXY85_3730 [Roseivirga pacifica]|uniref:DUF304 domain-containing protein n=1 Tax=Roseivirga pacifica TaxID=1267423 RepID=A0A1I0Q9U1_9BACT|nr:hypothetical protein [Roseivirga pacifica]RKQ43111.1 hypothetical protein BXY85_3730 [Roseivirga pacifica]SEW23785.1 hypothetical protein SAMN05216290_2145 [Roseivirga pacifica]